MKYKKMIALAALIIALVGCGTAAATGQISFSVDWIGARGAFELYQDRETGVQYIVFQHGKAFGITPRYNADGTLYCGR